MSVSDEPWVEPPPVGGLWESTPGALPGEYHTVGPEGHTTLLAVAPDTTPPPVPSAPIVSARLGVVQVEWDGLAAAGGSGIPADFARVEVALGTTSTPTTLRGTIMRAGGMAHINGLPYSTPHWVRLRAVDLSGNASEWSAAVETGVTPLVDADLIGSTVDSRFSDQSTATATAQSKADQAFADAASATSLANSASSSATTAHNAAVAAMDKAITAALAGGSLVLNGGFEQVDAAGAVLEWPAPSSARSYPTSGQRSGNRCIQVSTLNVTVYPPNWQPAASGRTYYVEGWFKKVSGDDTAPLVGFSVATRTGAGATGVHGVGRVAASTLTTDVWTKLSGEVTIAGADVVELRVGLYFTTGSNVYQVDDLMAVDITEAKAARDAAATAQDAANTADAKAVTAQNSANGRNSRITSTDAPTGTTHPITGNALVEGDTWFRWDATTTRNVIGQWTWRAGAWVAESIKSEVIANLDVNKLTVTGGAQFPLAVVDTLVGQEAFINRLYTNRLVVQGDNLLPDPQMMQRILWSNSARLQTTGGRSGGGALVIEASTTQLGVYQTLAVPGHQIAVVAGTKYRVEAWWRSAVAVTAANSVSIYYRWYSEAGVQVGTTTTVARNLAGSFAVDTWYQLTGTTVAAPVGATRLTVGFFKEAALNGETRFSDPSVRAMTGAVSIEDGAVTAPKLFADVAMANQLAAVFADFGTTRTNWLQAVHIDAGTFRGYVIEGADIKSSTTGDALNFIRLNDRTLTVQRDDGEGGSIITAQFGGSVSDKIVLRDTTGATQALFDATSGSGAVTGQMSVGDLVVDGDRLTDILEPLPRGILVQYWGSGDSLPAGGFGSTPYGIVKMRFPMVANRRYLFRASLAINGPSDQHADFALRSATDPSTVVAGSTRIKTWRAPMVGANQSVELSHPLFATAAETREILLTLNSTGAGPIYAVPGAADPSWVGQYWLEDLGYIDRSGTITATWTSGGGTPYSGSALTDATMPTTYTKEYAATWQRSWRGSTIVSDFLHHGYYGGLQRYSMVGFGGTIATDLSGATINKVEALVDNESWWGSSGTIYVGSATDTAAPASPVTTGTTANTVMDEGVQRWVPVGGFSTTSRAITLGVGAGTGTGAYGKFRYTGVRLRISYTK